MSAGLSRRSALLRGAGVVLGGAGLSAGACAAAGPLQVVSPWEVGGLAPAVSGHVFGRLQIAETLMEATDDGQPTPGLAQRWSVTDDGLSWRFVLHPRRRFHDGTALTAASVLPSLRAAQVAPAVLSLAPVRDLLAEDESTVRVNLTQPCAQLPALLAHSSTLVLAPSCFDAQSRVTSVLGTGPYRITALRPPQSIEAAWFEGYGGSRPLVEQVRYLAASRSETRALMAESGQADLAFGLDPASVQRLRLRRTLRLDSVTLPRTVVLKVNVGSPWLQDVRVRQALSLAIDRAGIAKALLRDPSLVATQLLPPSLSGWHDPALSALRFDLSAARQALRDAGWREVSAGAAEGGWRDARGELVTLTLRTFPDRPELPLLATALQAQWRALGLGVRVQIGNSGDIPLGHRDGSLQLGLAARNYANIPDATSTLAQDFGGQGSDWGAMGWQNAGVAQALAALSRGGASPERMSALRRQVVRVLHDELPVIPISWYRSQVAIGSRITGVRLDPLERSYRLSELTWAPT